jgi:hypothetical protein
MGTSDLSDKQALDKFLSGNQELERLSSKLSEFNVFRALRIENEEIRHSNTLAWLLNPNESHGLGDSVLRRVLSNILLGSEAPLLRLSSARVELMDLSDVAVFREESHIDILVIDNKEHWVLLIENKIHANEGQGQLARYRERIAKEYPKHELLRVFLTLEGRLAEGDGAADYVPYGYTQFLGVLSVLFEQKRSQLAEPVSVFLEQYIDTLRSLTMQDEKLIELCRQIYKKHQQAIDLIVDFGKASCFQTVAGEVVEKDGKYELIQSRGSWVVFLPKSWAEFLPTNGIMWTSSTMKRRVGVGCWFENYEGKAHLVFEVTAMTDPELRLKCVTALQKAGFKLGSKAFKEDTKYSRFYSSPRHKVANSQDEGEVKAVLQDLLKKAEEEGVFAKAEAVLRQVFAREPN